MLVLRPRAGKPPRQVNVGRAGVEAETARALLAKLMRQATGELAERRFGAAVGIPTSRSVVCARAVRHGPRAARCPPVLALGTAKKRRESARHEERPERIGGKEAATACASTRGYARLGQGSDDAQGFVLKHTGGIQQHLHLRLHSTHIDSRSLDPARVRGIEPTPSGHRSRRQSPQSLGVLKTLASGKHHLPSPRQLARQL